MVKCVYERLVASPLRGYPGGKFSQAKRLVPMFASHDCYCEVFAGAAWLLFSKSPSPVEVINDINGELINVYRQCRDNWEELHRLFTWSIKGREEFNRLRMMTAAEKAKLAPVKRAWRWLYLQKCAFAGDMGGDGIVPGRIARHGYGAEAAGARDRLGLLAQRLDGRLARYGVEADKISHTITGLGEGQPAARYGTQVEIAAGQLPALLADSSGITYGANISCLSGAQLASLGEGGKLPSQSQRQAKAGATVSHKPCFLEAVRRRLLRVQIENHDWSDILRIYDRPGTFFYLDPPYYGKETQYGRGVFSRETYGQMAAALAAIKGRFLLSINDSPETRAIFSAFNILSLGQITYSINRDSKHKRPEMVVANYDMEAEAALQAKL